VETIEIHQLDSSLMLLMPELEACESTIGRKGVNDYFGKRGLVFVGPEIVRMNTKD
jgi:hypothetical protein